jgi:hypothetical protein
MLQKKRQCKGSDDLTTIKDGYDEVWGVGELYDDDDVWRKEKSFLFRLLYFIKFFSEFYIL